MFDTPFWLRRRENGYWYVWYKHRPGWKSTKTKNEQHARDLAWAYVDVRPQVNITLTHFSEDFFIQGKCPYEKTERARGRSFSQAYFYQHRLRLQNYILPAWGGYILPAIQRRPVYEWLLDLKNMRSGEALGNDAKNKLLVCFRIIMDEAQDLGHIGENPLRTIRMFVPDTKERESFTLEELCRLFPEDRSALMEIWGSQMWIAFFLTLATTGWRPGEVAALSPEHWHRSRKAIIAKQAVDSATRTVKGLKTGKKGVKMKAALITDRLQQELLLREQQLKSDDEFFFHIGDKRPLQDQTTRRQFRKACVRAGVDPRARTQYCLRHAFSTDLHTYAPEEVVNRLMGHTRYRGEYDHREELALIRGLENAGVGEIVEKIRGLRDPDGGI